MKCWCFSGKAILNFKFILVRIFAVLCHFWEWKKVYEVGVKAKILFLVDFRQKETVQVSRLERFLLGTGDRIQANYIPGMNRQKIGSKWILLQYIKK